MKERDMMMDTSKEGSNIAERIWSQSAIDEESAKAMSLLELIEEVIKRSANCELHKVFFEWNRPMLEELAKRLDMTQMQAIMFAICLEDGDYVNTRELAEHLLCSNVKIMMYVKELEGLKAKRVLKVRRDRYNIESYAVRTEVVEALRNGSWYTYTPKTNITAEDLIDELNDVFDDIRDDVQSWEEAADNILELLRNNRKLSLSRIMEISDEECLGKDEQLLLCFMCVALAGFGHSFFPLTLIEKLFHSARRMVSHVKNSIIKHENGLLTSELLEFVCNEGIADGFSICLTEKAKKILLEDYNIQKAVSVKMASKMISASDIKEKALFYNKSEGEQIKILASLLEESRFVDVQNRLEKKGLRKGFACLFYGNPGTGKTESVYQLARMTGRDILEVNVEEIKSKWVGESENNMRQLFRHYYELSKCQSRVPILLFNEADAILGKRKEGAENGVDKMENSLQNIILQEMEKLEGIMIATTNLTQNLDKAFERRFLYKIHFSIPENEIKAKIWHSMLPDLTEEEATSLACRYDMSGGMIENITRKKSITETITGDMVDFARINEMCDEETIKSSRRCIGF